MRISTVLTLVALLTGGVALHAPVYAASAAIVPTPSVTEEQSCHLMPVADSGVALKRSQSVGVLYSENTVSTLHYLEQYHAVALNGARNGAVDSRIRQAFVDSSDPKLAIDWLNSSLVRQFASVTVYGSLDALMQARPDVVVMLDTYNQLVTQRNSKVQARFIAKFYDSNLQYIGKAQGLGTRELTSVWVHDKAAAQIALQIDQQRDLQIQALKQFDASLKALVSAGEVAQVAGN
ncbi:MULTISPECIES: ATPase [unclassified Pseudomonas]|uniref:ATPase n=1 Tax=unclassified Pseudomonas TaxID=196821 RepID=UPI0025EBED2F|nr:MULTISPECIES: ATPase [unclassified Pseudomonas]